MTITKDSVIGDILDFDNSTAEYFFEMGMHCLGRLPLEGKAWKKHVWFMA